MIHFRYYKKTKSLSFSLELPMHWPGPNWTHKWIPCNNRSLPNFIQISQHLGARCPKKLFSASYRGQPCL